MDFNLVWYETQCMSHRRTRADSSKQGWLGEGQKGSQCLSAVTAGAWCGVGRDRQSVLWVAGRADGVWLPVYWLIRKYWLQMKLRKSLMCTAWQKGQVITCFIWIHLTYSIILLLFMNYVSLTWNNKKCHFLQTRKILSENFQNKLPTRIFNEAQYPSKYTRII